MTDELAKQWMEWVKIKMDDDFYNTQIGKALEGGEPTALDFLKRAARIDPDFVERYYPGFTEELFKLEQSALS